MLRSSNPLQRLQQVDRKADKIGLTMACRANILPIRSTGVDIDRFIGDPYKAFTRVTNGGLNARTMLRNGDPYNPGPMGAVLQYRDDLSLATLESHFETSVYESPMIYFFYVQGGEGTIDSGPGTKSFKLQNGIGILVGPNVKQRFINTGDTQLSMIMLSWLNNDGMTAPKEILTVDTIAKPFGTGRAHWVHMAKSMFNTAEWHQHHDVGDLLPADVLRRTACAR